jgi:hypothetical protein
MRDFEWLAGYCAARDAKTGRGRPMDESIAMQWLDRQIARIPEQLELKRSLRSVVLEPAQQVSR